MRQAVEDNNCVQINELINQGCSIDEADQDAQETTPLQEAIKHNNPAMVKFLLDLGADCSNSLGTAAAYGHAEIISVLISRGANPLIGLAYATDSTIINELLDYRTSAIC